MIHPEAEDLRFQCETYANEKTDAYGNPDLASLLSLFQKGAQDHVERLGLGTEYLRRSSQLYVLCRIKGVFLRPFRSGETLTLVTYPRKPEKIQFYRDAYFLDSGDQPVFELSSLWVLLDSQTRRLRTTDSFVAEMTEKSAELRTLSPLFTERLYCLDEEEKPSSPSLVYPITEKDIDSNGHMNNTVYAALAAKAGVRFPLRSFEIDFEKECFAGETLSLYVTEKESSVSVQGYQEKGLLSVQAEFVR